MKENIYTLMQFHELMLEKAKQENDFKLINFHTGYIESLKDVLLLMNGETIDD